MKTNFMYFFFLLIMLATPSAGAGGDRYVVEDFSSSVVGHFPKGWRTRLGEGARAKTVYRVEKENGAKYLSADDKDGSSVQIFKLAHWDFKKFPLLKWRWRARALPIGADETAPEKNDSACGIYVSFGMFKGTALKYVWSSSTPAGTFYKKNDNLYIIVKRTGSAGKWEDESANIVEDALKAFGKPPSRDISGIAILTDSNATHAPSACGYGGIGYGEAELE